MTIKTTTMTIVLVDTATILRNPRENGIRYFAPGRRSMRVTTTGLHPEFKDEENCYIIESLQELGSDEIKYEIEVACNELAEKIVKKEIPVDSFQISTNQTDVTRHEPEYFYEYIPTKVPCNECGWPAYHTGLGDSEWDDYCDNCGAMDSYDYQYESIGDAIIRAGLNVEDIPYAKTDD